MKGSCWEPAWVPAWELALEVAAGREDTGRGRGSCFWRLPTLTSEYGRAVFHRKKASKFRSTGTIFALKLQMFPNFMMVWLTMFWLDGGMKEISL